MRPVTFLLAGLSITLPAAASPTVALKCSANDDRVWVYDGLQSFNVTARLRCGTSVQVLEARGSYAKIRMPDGSEGYVPATAVPSQDIIVVNAAPAPARVAAVAQASAPASASAAAAPSVAATHSAAPLSASPTMQAIAPAKPGPAPIHAESAEAAPVIAVAPTAQIVVVNEPVSAAIPAPAPAAPARKTVALQEVKAPAISAPSFSAEPMVVRASDMMPAKPKSFIPHTAQDTSDLDKDDDMPAVAREDAVACNAYFSAYGVTPMQLKWIADDRRKRFPGVCPAPEPSAVDYVIIFTHDMPSFSNTLPVPIHTDHTGFSDWSPVTAVDDNVIPLSPLDKAHDEYAWVFHVRRGTFNPAGFSARRRPQFTRRESSSHASSKAAEDAMQFIAQSGPKQ